MELKRFAGCFSEWIVCLSWGTRRYYWQGLRAVSEGFSLCTGRRCFVWRLGHLPTKRKFPSHGLHHICYKKRGPRIEFVNSLQYREVCLWATFVTLHILVAWVIPSGKRKTNNASIGSRVGFLLFESSPFKQTAQVNTVRREAAWPERKSQETMNAYYVSLAD